MAHLLDLVSGVDHRVVRVDKAVDHRAPFAHSRWNRAGRHVLSNVDAVVCCLMAFMARTNVYQVVLVPVLTELARALAVADMQTFEDAGLVKDDSDGDAQNGEVALLRAERAKDIVFLSFRLTTFSYLECGL